MLGMQRAMLSAALGLCFNSAVGGWAVISVENPPGYLEAGATYRLEYSVRQHGVTLLNGLSGSVVLQPAGSGPGEGLSVQSVPGTSGRYSVSFRVPDADRVTVMIKSGFSGNRWGDLTMMPIPVVRAGAPPPNFTPTERGRQLFVAKGCGTCHVNGDVPEYAQLNQVMAKVAPELTGRRLEAAYVRQRLTNPASLPALGDGGVRMPNLGLGAGEVDALVALLAGPTQRAAQ
jgi:hypothetical protein